MQVRTPSIGEVEEVRSVEDLEARWAKTSNQQWALFELMNESQVGSEEWLAYSKAFEFVVKRNDAAVKAYREATDREQAKQDLQALLQDAMDRGEHEAFDEHYDCKPVLEACEVDEADPWVEEAAAVAADAQADAAAREIEAQA